MSSAAEVLAGRARWAVVCADVLAGLRELPDESVHCVVTSPPYWGLRDYGVDGQIGLEPTYHEYIARIVAVFEEVRRVLRKDGCCFINLGDSYYSAPGNGRGGGSTLSGGRPHLSGSGRRGRAYGTADIAPAALGSNAGADFDRYAAALGSNAGADFDRYGKGYQKHSPPLTHPLGRNKRSVWTIATEAYPDAHFATFPTALVEPCVLAGTSAVGCCPSCGASWKRMTERTSIAMRPNSNSIRGSSPSSNRTHAHDSQRGSMGVEVETLGWAPTCRCDAGEPVPCLVLDPFAGSGTTLMVALRHDRRAIGIELSPVYVAMAERRIIGDSPLFNQQPGRADVAAG